MPVPELKDSFITTPGVSGVICWGPGNCSSWFGAVEPLSDGREGSCEAVEGAGGGGMERSTGEGVSVGKLLPPGKGGGTPSILCPLTGTKVIGLDANAFPTLLLLLDRDPLSNGVEVVDFEPLC